MSDVRHKKGQRGFTLIETSIALVVLLVAGLGAASLFSYSINYNTGANDRALAQSLAQRQMEQLRKTPFPQVLDSDQTLTSAGRPFDVATRVCNDGSVACGGSPAFKKITVTVTPRAGASRGWMRSSVVLVTLRGTTNLGPYFP